MVGALHSRPMEQGLDRNAGSGQCHAPMQAMEDGCHVLAEVACFTTKMPRGHGRHEDGRPCDKFPGKGEATTGIPSIHGFGTERIQANRGPASARGLEQCVPGWVGCQGMSRWVGGSGACGWGGAGLAAAARQAHPFWARMGAPCACAILFGAQPFQNLLVMSTNPPSPVRFMSRWFVLGLLRLPRCSMYGPIFM